MARRPIKFKTCRTCKNRWELGDFHPKDWICWRCWDKSNVPALPVDYHPNYLQSSALTTMRSALSAGKMESWD